MSESYLCSRRKSRRTDNETVDQQFHATAITMFHTPGLREQHYCTGPTGTSSFQQSTALYPFA
jgi:hypothetical protein